MSTGHVLVIGSRDSSSKVGIETDENVLALNGCPALTAVTASKSTKDGILEITETSPESFEQQINGHSEAASVSGLKIGALFSTESVATIFKFIESCKDVQVVVDAEAVFKTGKPTEPKMTQALRENILPKTTVLSATVPEAKLLLDDAGLNVEYPKSMQDVKKMAQSLQSLGPATALIKREIFNKDLMKTTLFYVLCQQDASPVEETMVFDNPKGLTGISYALPSAITANLVSGQNVVEAVHTAYLAVGKTLESGEGTLV